MSQNHCDGCGQHLETVQLRYVVRMDVRATTGRGGQEDEGDRDHLLELHEMLEPLDAPYDTVPQGQYGPLEYTLCAECQQRFLSDPLGRDVMADFGFSRN